MVVCISEMSSSEFSFAASRYTTTVTM